MGEVWALLSHSSKRPLAKCLFSRGAVRKWLTACWCSAPAGSQIGACTDDSGAFLLPCAVWNGSCLSSPSPMCCLSQFVFRAGVAPVYRWDILSSRRNLYKSICCKIVPVFYYFCAENEHRLSCSNCSRIYWKNTFWLQHCPSRCQLDGLVDLFTCGKHFALMLFNLCSDLKEQLLKYRPAFMSVSQRNMFFNSAVKRFNKLPLIRI